MSVLSGNRPIARTNMLNRRWHCSRSRGSRRRSVPVRSGAAQFALRALPPFGYVTISEEHNVATAAGGGTQDANCAAPERMSPTYCRHNVYHTDSKILYRLKRFLCTKRKIWSPSCSLKRFLGTICTEGLHSAHLLRRHGSRRRSVPVRSGALQFALLALPPFGYVTWSLT